MRKVLLCIMMVLCTLSINEVNASNTYNEQEFLENKRGYFPGDKIIFNNQVEIIVKDMNNSVICETKTNELILPDYPTSHASFKGWNVVQTSRPVGGNLTKVFFKPEFRTLLNIRETNDSYILSVNSSENPFLEGDYYCEWFRAGLGFGYKIDGPNQMSWSIPKDKLSTIDPNNSHVENGIQVALAIHKKDSSAKILSNSVMLKPEVKEETPDVPVEKPIVPEQKPEEKPVVPADKEQKPEQKPAVPTDKEQKPQQKPSVPTDKQEKPEEKPVTPTDKEEKPSVPQKEEVIENRNHYLWIWFLLVVCFMTGIIVYRKGK